MLQENCTATCSPKKVRNFKHSRRVTFKVALVTMLFALKFFCFASIGVRALPIPTAGLTLSTCDDLRHCRTIWNITWSCIVTISSCTWVTIHPNIPASNDSKLSITLRRVKLVLIALVAPELIVLWAIRQWLVTRRVHWNREWVPIKRPDRKYRTKDGKGVFYLHS